MKSRTASGRLPGSDGEIHIFRNTVVIQPFEDGTFRYLSNSIAQIELELPEVARTKG